MARRQVFVEELNLAITGAISGARRYGWLFYFLEINDAALLHQLDAVVAGFFARSPIFGGAPSGLKRFVRGYYEAKYRPTGTYLLNYDRFVTLTQKVAYLQRFGLLASPGSRSPEEIQALFDRARARQLHRLELDIGRIS